MTAEAHGPGRTALAAVWAVAILIGVVVGAVTSDVILGVIAGASCVAITVGLVRLWSGDSATRPRRS